MAVEEVGARLSLKDRPAFSRDVRHAEGDIDRLGRTAKDTGGEMSALGRLSNGAVGGISAVGRIAAGAAVGVAAITGAAAAAGIALVNMASDAQEVESRFETVFGTGGADQVSAWIRDIQGEVHIATDELQSAASTFGVFGQAVGLSAMELPAFSTDLAQAGLDLASFSNEDPSQVFDALRSGLSGESEPLRQFGIFLSDASLNAFAAAEGIGETTAEMTEQEKVLLRQRFILSNLGSAQGDLARTSEGFANQQRGLLGAFRDLRVELGEALLPAAERVMPLLTDGLQSALFRVSEEMPTLQRRIEDWTMSAVDGFGEASDLLGEIRTTIGDLGFEQGSIVTVEEMFGADAAGTLTGIFDIAEQLGEVWTDLLVPAWQDSQEALGPLAGATGDAFVAMLGYAADNAEELVPLMSDLFQIILVSKVVGTVSGIAGAVRGLSGAMGAANATGGGLVATLGGLGPAVAGAAIALQEWDETTANARSLTSGGWRGAAEGLLNTGAQSLEVMGLGIIPTIAEQFGVNVDPIPTIDLTPTPVNPGVPSPAGVSGIYGTGDVVAGLIPSTFAPSSARPASNGRPGGPQEFSGATITVNMTNNLPNVQDPEAFRRALQQNGRALAEELQRELEIARARD